MIPTISSTEPQLIDRPEPVEGQLAGSVLLVKIWPKTLGPFQITEYLNPIFEYEPYRNLILITSNTQTYDASYYKVSVSIVLCPKIHVYTNSRISRNTTILSLQVPQISYEIENPSKNFQRVLKFRFKDMYLNRSELEKLYNTGKVNILIKSGKIPNDLFEIVRSFDY
jgi:hypothetical protein